MDLSPYFDPIDLESIEFASKPTFPQLGDNVIAYTEGNFPDLQGIRLAIVGIMDDRNAANNSGCAQAPDEIRRKLYPLALPHLDTRIADLGNIKPGQTPEDTYYAVTQTVYKLLERNITVILLGSGQDHTFAAYRAYEILGQVINICSIDSRFDLDGNEGIDSRNYLKHIIMQDPNFLFGFTNIGYQTYFCGENYIKLMDQLNFDAYRLGAIQQQMERAEPLIRNADIVTLDLGAVRQSDAPANADPSPHGFYGEQICQMSRFAGMSDKTSCFGVFELNPRFDSNHQTAHMVAHALWYFIEGFYNRKSDFPNRDKHNYRRYTVQLQDQNTEIIFHKSKKSERWWFEVPCNDEERRQRYDRHLLVPCNYSDYLQALENEVPELWWHYYQRFNG